jgi:hypothetical protein
VRRLRSAIGRDEFRGELVDARRVSSFRSTPGALSLSSQNVPALTLRVGLSPARRQLTGVGKGCFVDAMVPLRAPLPRVFPTDADR